MNETVTDAAVQIAAIEFLKTCNLETTTLSVLKCHLETKLGCRLVDRQLVIREALENFVLSASANDDDYKEFESSDDDGRVIRPVQLGGELAEFMGVAVCSRNDVPKRIWAYIKEKNLQNPDKRQSIVCDETLQKLFKKTLDTEEFAGSKEINMFKMTKYLKEVSHSKWFFELLDLWMSLELRSPTISC